MLDKNFFSIYFDHLHNRLQTVNTADLNRHPNLPPGAPTKSQNHLCRQWWELFRNGQSRNRGFYERGLQA